MIQHFLEERFHKAVRFFSTIRALDASVDGGLNVGGAIKVSGDVEIEGELTVKSVNPARPYKVYTALLKQTGTNAPVATVLENTLGGTVVWARTSAGVYSATLVGAFTLSKTFVLIYPSYFNQAFYSNGHEVYITANVITLTNPSGFDWDAGDTIASMIADSNGRYFEIEIRVYP